MSASKHGFTKGPWRWWTSNSVRRLSSDPSRKDGDVLYSYVHCGMSDIQVSKEDAALIEASPELYEALEELIPWALYWINDNQPAMQKARAALSRANGEG